MCTLIKAPNHDILNVCNVFIAVSKYHSCFIIITGHCKDCVAHYVTL